MGLRKAEDKLAGAYAKRRRVKKENLDAGTVSVLLDVVLTLLGMCRNRANPQAILKTVKEEPVQSRVRVRQALRKMGVKRRDMDDVVESVMDAAATATPEEIEELTQEENFGE